ncbi:MAG: AI-2E family transporter [Nocardioidaceae bacterium]
MEPTEQPVEHAGVRRMRRLVGRQRAGLAGERTPSPELVRKARVPYGVDLAAQWAWRFLVVVAAAYVVVRALGFLMVVVLPVVIALFITALVQPVVSWLSRRLPRPVASILTVVLVLAGIVAALTYATSQVVNGSQDLAAQVVNGLDEIQNWLKTGPFHVTDDQIQNTIEALKDLVSSKSSEITRTATEVGTVVGHIVAGFFIVLFSTYFFLADGASIWQWIVRIFPKAARPKANSSGFVAWTSLTQFVRATVLVAATDAIGIGLVALILGVPFVAAIGLLVFLGAFVPMVGATVSGAVAVLVALVAKGPIAALIMLGGVIAVQQLEAHVLQPFLMGRFVSVHPLGVILAIAVGVIVAGIPGALIAVPLAATVNAVIGHLAAGDLDEEIAEHERE